jgi:hypothetical protein
MKFRLQGSITIPKRPSTVGGLIGWARGVNKTLQELRDRKIVGATAKESRKKPYPFEISASGELLKSAPGLLGSVSIASQEKANPADGVHYLLAKVIINSTSGVITSSTVEWVTTVPTDTTTNYHLTIAKVTLSDGQISIDPAETAQYTYGPISVVIGGGRDSKWMARLL